MFYFFQVCKAKYYLVITWIWIYISILIIYIHVSELGKANGLEGCPYMSLLFLVSLSGLQLNHITYQDASEMALYWLRPGFHECHTICGGLRAGRAPLRPTSALVALELASVALCFPRSQSGAVSQLHVPLCCWTLHCLQCLTVSDCGRWQPFIGQERAWHGSCRTVSVEGGCWRATALPCSDQGQLENW